MPDRQKVSREKLHEILSLLEEAGVQDEGQVLVADDATGTIQLVEDGAVVEQIDPLEDGEYIAKVLETGGPEVMKSYGWKENIPEDEMPEPPEPPPMLPPDAPPLPEGTQMYVQDVDTDRTGPAQPPLPPEPPAAPDVGEYVDTEDPGRFADNDVPEPPAYPAPPANPMFGTEKPYQVDAPVAGQPRSETLSSLLENRPSDRAMLAAIDKAAPGLGSGNNNAMVAAMMKARRLEREREMMKKKQILARLMGKGPSGTA